MRGHGTQLLMSDMAASPTYTAIADVVSITPPGSTRGRQVNSTHDTVGLHEKVADPLGDITDFRFRLRFDWAEPTHDQTDGIRAAERDGLSRDWRIIYTDGTQEDFSGAIVQFEFEPIEQNQGTVYANCAIAPEGMSDIT